MNTAIESLIKTVVQCAYNVRTQLAADYTHPCKLLRIMLINIRQMYNALCVLIFQSHFNLSI